MRRVSVLVVAAGVASVTSVGAQSAQPGRRDGRDSAALTPMPRDLEIAFALSAAPRHLRAAAEVFILDPSSGYVPARAGSNGFRCLVVRTEWNWPQLPFRDDIYFPVCSDAAGTAAWLPVYIDVAAMRARGQTPQAIHAEVTRRFADGTYHAPARAGISYMLGPVMRTYGPASEQPMTMVGAHYMFYAPNVTDSDIGGNPTSSGPFMLSPGPHGLIFLLAGDSKQKEILTESRDLLARLCAYRSVLCLPPPAGTAPHPPPSRH
jgi:hypothetical protein